MANHVKRTLPEVLEAVEKGITVTGAAKVLGVDPDTIRNYAKRWKSVDDAIKGKRREMVDLAEMGLRGAVLRGEPWAVTFALKTLGRDDGYGDRTEVTGPGGGPIRIAEVVFELAGEGKGGGTVGSAAVRPGLEDVLELPSGPAPSNAE